MRRHSPISLALLSLAACAAGADGKSTSPAGASDEFPAADEPREVSVDPPRGALGVVLPVSSREKDVRLKGPRVDAAPSDYVLTHAGKVAVISARGNLVDYGVEGGVDALTGLVPNLQIGFGAAQSDLTSIDIVGEKANVVRVRRKVRGQPLEHVIFYSFGADGALFVESVAVASPDAKPADPGPVGAVKRLPAFAVTLGESLQWGNVPTWAEGAGHVYHQADLRSAFVARDGFGTSYAACAEQGPFYARFGEPVMHGFFEAALTGERVVPVVVGGSSERRRLAITVSDISSGDAALALPCGLSPKRGAVVLPTVNARHARAEIFRCDDGKGRRPFVQIGVERARFGADTRSVNLPEGCFEARLIAPGYAPGPLVRAESLAAEPREKVLPRAGRLRVHVTESAKPLPGRLFVRGREGTSNPDWGDEPFSGAALDVAYLERGEGELPLPPGKYHVAITHGFEYTAHEEDIEIAPDKEVDVRASLSRVVDTKGWISADLHLHAEPSPDAPTPLADRVRSLVSVGVEAAVATDHNAVTDYAPIIREMGLASELASLVGDEITTRDPPWGHFNVFPLAPGSLPLPWVGLLPAEIFAAAREQKPYGASTILQVNHPRMGGIGYFDLLRMEPGGSVRSFLDGSPVADLGFDLIEVYNGDYATHIPYVEAVMRDFYALLDAGFHAVATGNSDSHKANYHEAGVPRNMVFVGNDSDAPSSFREGAFVDALRQGKVSVSGGPFVRIEAGGKTMGETIPPGETEVVIRVDAPPWMDIDRIELVKKGKVIRTFPVSARKGAIEQRSREALQAGDWILAIARGSKSMDVYVPGVVPFGFTNAVFVK